MADQPETNTNIDYAKYYGEVTGFEMQAVTGLGTRLYALRFKLYDAPKKRAIYEIPEDQEYVLRTLAGIKHPHELTDRVATVSYNPNTQMLESCSFFPKDNAPFLY